MEIFSFFFEYCSIDLIWEVSESFFLGPNDVKGKSTNVAWPNASTSGKRFVDDNDDALFTATISALDINKFNNEVLVKIKVAKEILSTMNLNENGSMHPEKFHNKMIEYVDLSEEEFVKKEDISQYLYDLETLCERCLQYESNIEWKSIS